MQLVIAFVVLSGVLTRVIVYECILSYSRRLFYWASLDETQPSIYEALEEASTSQIIGGIGMAMFEEAISDARTGRIANGTFGDYLVAVNADVPDMAVIFVGEPDRYNPIGVKGVGEIGLVGIATAIANALFHATGRRIRSLPITIDHLLPPSTNHQDRRPLSK